MKKLIRKLIPRSIEKEIRNEALREIGGSMIGSDCHWFNKYPMVGNTIYAIGRDLQKYAHYRISNIRDEVYEAMDKRIY